MKYRIYIGTYTEPIRFGTGEILQSKGKGIVAADFNSENGEIIIMNVNEGIENPSFFTLDPSGKYLYAVNELKVWENTGSGTISSFKIDKESGKLKFLNRKLTHGTDPCHISMTKKGKAIYVSNFMSGSICVRWILEDGSLSDDYQIIQHTGSGVHPVRQQGPHAHSCIFDNNNSYAVVPDLGIDKLMVYKVDQYDGKLLEPAEEIVMPAGAGPRSGCFNRAGNRFYVIQELASRITVYEYKEGEGKLNKLQTADTLLAAYTANNICAHIQLTPDEKFLFASNRGHDSITTFRVDKEDGTLTYLRTQSCRGKTPRHFAIDPSGKFLLAANQDTDQIVVFAIDQVNGELTAVHAADIGTPVCVQFA